MAEVDLADNSKRMAARAEFNLCPMCWMPLYSNSGSMKNDDFSWGLVQFVFKGKPAFSIQADGYKHERSVLVFGVSDLHSDAKSNCEDCHFIHKSTYNITQRFQDIWDKSIALDQSVMVDTDNRQVLSYLEESGYEDGIGGFCQSLCAGKGLWSGVYDFVTLFDGMSIEDSMGYLENNGIVNKLKSVFPGCRDCNSKMTVSKYIQPLIRLLALKETLYTTDANGILKISAAKPRPARGQPRGRGRGRGGVNIGVARPRKEKALGIGNEMAMNYILLCGMMEPNDKIGIGECATTTTFKILDMDHILTWKFRYALTWCLLQILFPAWEDARVNPFFRHHLSYVYTGIKDFYMSLFFFVMHCANGFTTTLHGDFTFEAFHFFYSSHMPFYLMDKEGGNPAKCHSLSELILTGVQFSSDDFNRQTVSGDFDNLKKRMVYFWSVHFKPLSNFIHGRRGDGPYSLFFVHPSKAMEYTTKCQRSNEMGLNVQTFNDYFTATPGYWFHFKNITMANIEKDCKIYFDSNEIELVKQVWAQWYNYLCMCVQRLGMNAGAALRSRFFFSLVKQQPKLMHLSCILSSSTTSRWRLKYCGV